MALRLTALAALGVALGCGRLGYEPLEDWVTIAAGPFMMGCNVAIDDICYEGEDPYHEITLSAYSIGRTEVTQGAYQQCIDDGGCSPPADATVFDPLNAPSRPVRAVTWDQALTYCTWSSARLPTEAQWEKAARGDDGRLYPWGNTPPDCTLVNAAACSNDVIDVGSLPAGASPYGALDMAGNVWEWVRDFYDVDYYLSSPAMDPTGPSSGTAHVQKGGYYENTDVNLRASRRRSQMPSVVEVYVGFRCAR